MAATIIVLRILSWWWVYILYGNCTHSGYQVNAYTPTSTSAKSTSSIATNATIIQQNSTYKIPIQVYILAGQSNMVGLGSISHLDVLIRYNGSSSTSSNMSQGIYQNEYFIFTLITFYYILIVFFRGIFSTRTIEGPLYATYFRDQFDKAIKY